MKSICLTRPVAQTPWKCLLLLGATAVAASAQTPPNDAFANAAMIAGPTAQVTGSNVGATMETGEPVTIGGYAAGQSVWWRWTAPYTGAVGISTAGSSIGNGYLMLAVYTGEAVNALTLVAADAGASSRTTSLSLPVVYGTTYRIALCSYSGVTGAITLTLDPAITVPPLPQGVFPGATHTFSVMAAGTAPLSYAWRKNGVPIPDRTQAHLAIPNVQLADTGRYDVVVTNGSGAAVFSPSGRLAVEAISGGASRIAAGENHSLILKSDGTLVAFGFNASGQLGDGTNVNRSAPVAVATNVARVSAGENHTVFAKNDGTAWAMGYNFQGQLGDGATYGGNATSPVQVATGVVEVAAGRNFTLFLKTDGSVWATGDNNLGQFGNGTTTSQPVPVNVIPSGVAHIAAGSNSAYFIKTDASLWAAGDNSYGQLGDGSTTNRASPVAIATGVAQVAAGRRHAVFLKTDGTVWTTGTNEDGELGDGATTTYRTSPYQAASGAASIGAGLWNCFVVKTDGSSWATGWNEYGQLGEATPAMWTTFTRFADGVVGATTGYYHGIALARNGAVWTSGGNVNGQLGDGTVTSRMAATQVLPGLATAPAIVVQPQPVTVGVGLAANFVVGATGTAPWTYQWRKGGGNISGATNAALALPAVQVSDAGNYDVVVTNAAGPATSTAAALTVLSPPTITTQPQAQTVTVGANVTFTVVVSGSPSPSYQWKKDGADISGETNASLTLANVQLAAAGSYTVVASNGQGTPAVSNAAVLTVNPALAAPVISSPQTAAATVGLPFTYTITASNSPTSFGLTGPLPAGVAFNGTSGLISGTPTAVGTHVLSMTATNAGGTSPAVSLTLTVGAASAAPVITTQPQSQTVTAGANVTFTVAASGNPSPSYQWKKDTIAISTATNASLVLNNVTAEAAGSYTVVVSNGVGSPVTSEAAVLTVNAAGIAPTITAHPKSVAVPAGTSATFSVVAAGTPPLAYQWKREGVDITGANGATLTVANVQALQTGSYTVVVSNGTSPSATSNPATLVITAPYAVNFDGFTANATLNAQGTPPWTAYVDPNYVDPRVVAGDAAHATNHVQGPVDWHGSMASAPVSPALAYSAGSGLAEWRFQLSVPSPASGYGNVSALLTFTNTQGVTYGVRGFAPGSSIPSGFTAGTPAFCLDDALGGMHVGTAMTPGAWYEVELIVDFTAASPTGSLAYRNLTAGQTTFTPDPLLQNIDLKLTTTNGLYTFNTVKVWPFNGGRIDDITASLASPVIPITTAASTLAKTPDATTAAFLWNPGVTGTWTGFSFTTGSQPCTVNDIAVRISGTNTTVPPAGLLFDASNSNFASTSAIMGFGTPDAVTSSPATVHFYPAGTVTLAASHTYYFVLTVPLMGNPPGPGSYEWARTAAANGVDGTVASGWTMPASYVTKTFVPPPPDGSGTAWTTVNDYRLVAAISTSGTTSSAPQITSGTTAAAIVGTAFTFPVTASNNPTSYAATGLPPGLSLAASTGLISGTPTTAGTYPVSLTATNNAGTSPAATLTIIVGSGGAPSAVTSPFTDSGENWSVVTFVNLASNDYTPMGTFTPTHSATGGNPGGYISIGDPDSGDSTFSAPAAFLGNRSSAYGMALTYDLIHPAGGNDLQAADVILVGNGLRLVWQSVPALMPSANWSTFSVSLAPSAQWHVGTTTGAAPTAAEFQGVLGNVTGLYIRTEYYWGTETTGLDNVAFGAPLLPPVITTPPQGQTVTAGGTATFSVTATGTAPLTFIWAKNGTVISTATTSVLTLTNVQASDAGNYTVTVGNGTGTPATSTPVALTVNAGPANDLFANRANLTGSSVTATGNSTGATKETGEPAHASNVGGASLWWTWTAPATGTVVIDTNGTTFDTTLGVYTGTAVGSLTSVAFDDDSGDGYNSQVTFEVTSGMVYQIAVDGYNGAAGAFTLHVTLGGGTAPSISAQPQSVAVLAGGNATFTITATGTPTPSYRWQVSSDGGLTWIDAPETTPFAGATSASLTLTGAATAQDNLQFHCTVSNTAGSVISSPAVLRVRPATVGFGGTDEFGAPGNWSAPGWGGNGRLNLANSRLEYTAATGTTADFALREWTANVGSYTQNWSVQVDVHLDPLALTAPQYANLNLIVINGDEALAPVGQADTMVAAIDRYGDGSNTVRGFEGDLVGNGNRIPATGMIHAPSASTDGALRITFDAATKELKSWYDADGAANGYVWTLLQAVNIGSGTYTWGMSDSSTFLVALVGGSSGVALNSGQAWFDNFAASGATGTPVITSAPTAWGTIGTAFNHPVIATNAPTSYALTGTLPSGLTFNNATGIISGTPTVIGTYPVTLTASNAAGTSAAVTLAITIMVPGGTWNYDFTSAGINANYWSTVNTSGTFTFTATPGTGVIVAGGNGSFQTGKLRLDLSKFAPLGDFNLTAWFVAGQLNGGVHQIQLETNWSGGGVLLDRSNQLSVGVPGGHSVNVYDGTNVLGLTPVDAAGGTSSPGCLTLTRIGSTFTGYWNGVPFWTGTYSASPLTEVYLALNDNYGATDATAVTWLSFSITAPAIPVGPTIGQQPISQSVAAGQTATFSVAATGPAAVTYQWRKNTVALSGATMAQYVIASAQPADAGLYDVVVTCNGVDVISSGATLTVTGGSDLLGWWTGDDSAADATGRNTAGTLLGGATFGAGRIGQAFVFDGVDDWVNLGGQTGDFGSADFSISFWARFNDLSREQTLIEDYIETESATRSGWCINLKDGGLFFGYNGGRQLTSASLSAATWYHVAVTRVGPTFKLYLNGTVAATGTESVALSSTAALKLGHRGAPADTPGSVDTRGFYFNGTIDNLQVFGRALSEVEVQGISAGPPVITVQPQSQNITAGTGAMFSVVATGTMPLTYQWTKGGVPITGETSAVLILGNVQTSQAGVYAVIVGNVGGTLISEPATLTVNPAGGAPSNDNFANRIQLTGVPAGTTGSNVGATKETGEPNHWSAGGASVWWTWTAPSSASVTIDTAGSSFDTLLAVYTGTAVGALTPIASNDDADGVTSAVTFPATAGTVYQIAVDGWSGGSGNISLHVSSGGGAAIPVITSPNMANGTVGMPFTYAIVATNAAVSYTATALPGGLSLNATSGAISGTPTTAGTTEVTLTASNAASTSVPFTLTIVITGQVGPTITMPPAPQVVAIGGSVSFTVQATGTPPLTYQWLKGTTPISGAVDATLTLTNVQAGDAGSYAVTVTNAVSSATSTAAQLHVGLPAAVRSVAAGTDHTMFVTTDGKLWGMGGNTAGQLGIGSLTTQPTPVPVSTGVEKVVAGIWHTLFLKTDGTLWSMGHNPNGAIGDGTKIQRSVPFPLATGVTAMAAGYFHSAFVKSDGTLWTVGDNSSGQLGDGTTTERLTPVQVPGVANVTAVSAGNWHTMFLKADGTLWAMGANDSGQLFDGTTTSRTSPVQVATDVAAVSAGWFHTLVLKADGTLMAAGNNEYGQLGDGTTTNRVTPVQIATGVAQISARFSHSAFVKTDGSLWTTGVNDHGQLGDGTLNNRPTPASFTTGVTTVAVGNRHTVWIKTDNSLWGVGGNGTSQLGRPSSAPILAPIMIVAGAAGAPMITTHPASQTVTAGGSVTFTVVANGTEPLSYQWKKNTVDIGGANAATLTLSNLSSADAGTYAVTVSNAAGTVLSAPALLTVGTTTTAPTINTHPASQTIGVGGSVTFSVVATGTAPLSYQWYKGTTAIGTATGSSYTISSAQVADAADYRVIVSNSAGEAYSQYATLTVLTAPTITTQPQSQTVLQGATATFLVIVNSQGMPTYQWSKNGSPIPSGTQGVYSIPAVQPADAGGYSVVVTNGGGSVTSATATLTVDTSSTGVAPAITAQPASASVTAGQTASFTVAASGTPTPSIKWQRSTDGGVSWLDLVDGGGISGVSAKTLVVAGATPSMSGHRFRAIAMNGVSPNAHSGTATLTVTATGATITAQPVDQSVLAGGSAAFSIAAAGTGTLSYRWYYSATSGGTPQALSDLTGKRTGSLTANLALTNVQAADAGYYVCVVTDSAGEVTSQAAVLSIVPRVVRLVSQTAAAGSEIVVPVQLVAGGGENAVSFSLNFDPSKLTYVSSALGADAAGSTMTRNVTAKDTGSITYLIGKEPGTSYAAGTWTILNLTFSVNAAASDAAVLALNFGDTPTWRRIVGVNSDVLEGAFVDGAVTVSSGYEGDVTGNGEVDAADWVKLGRIVVGLDPMPTGATFMKADAAPRASKGDAVIDAGDWVQLGRYVVGLDPLQTAGGPSAPAP